MKPYEIAYLISSELSEEEVRTFQGKITSFVKEEEGILDEARMPLRKRLAYPIEKQNRAYLAFFTFQLNPDSLVNLEKKLKAENQILRYLILIKKPLKPIKERVRKLKTQPEPVDFEENKAYIEKEKKVELKEIEKKLEEILKE
ncbi:MAG: 30S ribosomal protein S6 [Candidatus Nealsonbacteria bacterium]|nr:30S ribosomal protein S6 [Candidatus Nealsonbacteria bacterium]